MICQPCRDNAHDVCPEVARREHRADLNAIELKGGPWCDCQHKPRAEVQRRM